jgi:hypothetical protein
LVGVQELGARQAEVLGAEVVLVDHPSGLISSGIGYGERDEQDTRVGLAAQNEVYADRQEILDTCHVTILR